MQTAALLHRDGIELLQHTGLIGGRESTRSLDVPVKKATASMCRDGRNGGMMDGKMF
jgi:hypothetical protein